MKIYYGITRRERRGSDHKRRRLHHRNFTTDLPVVNLKTVLAMVEENHPGWALAGYCLYDEDTPAGGPYCPVPKQLDEDGPVVILLGKRGGEGWPR